jgi:anti-sigma-K factor RskA
MSCQERRDQIFLHVAGVLEDDERAELEAHLASGCRRCQEALEAEREGLATLALALPPVSPPARVRERLLARVREQAFRGAGNGARPPPRIRALRLHSRWRRPAALAGAALGGAALAFGIAWWQLGERPAEERPAPAAEAPSPELAEIELASLREAIDEQDQELAELEGRVEAAGEISNLLAARELDVLELSAAQPGSDAFGRAFWDPDYHCYFRARGLPPLSGEQRYVLWMIGADDRLHPAGTLEPDAEGDHVIFTRLPRELSPISKSFVTAEAELGEQPAGPTLLVGEARS